jgi:hypothetical protein
MLQQPELFDLSDFAKYVVVTGTAKKLADHDRLGHD